ncbi:MAG: Crp/Fnr family transcriptional regulator [Treponema sp.]|nr:Crp/Fnr family transcriptional regulator [Treponema sp.]
MPKAISYTKGSIIYFAGDIDERVFILQKGTVIATTNDIETKLPVTEQIKNGEFFGVKSAVGHFPREETVTALQEAVCITMTIQEFEALFSTNKQIMMKMLRVFSNQLRQIHRKTESILSKGETISQMQGMFSVATAFFNDERWRTCLDVCTTFLKLYPTSEHVLEIKGMLAKADAHIKKGDLGTTASSDSTSIGTAAPLKLFELPAFKRFAKTYEPGQVIITEYQNGDSFYLIQSGSVQLTKCANGTNKNLDILKPGELFGEMAILDNSPRSATCFAVGPVECLEFNKENFEVLVTGNPQIALMLLRLFCKRIYDQKRRLRILVISDPQARLADVFCMFNEMGPVVAERQRKFNLTPQDLAHWSGLSPEVTKDEINRFVMTRKIEAYDTYIVVNNMADMKRIVDTKTNTRT